MWHASIARHDSQRRPVVLGDQWGASQQGYYLHALRALRGVGDPALGEWMKAGRVALHVQRRLTDEEWGGKPWGHDLRGTPEGEQRLDVSVRRLIPDYQELP